MENFGQVAPIQIGSHHQSGDVLWDINNTVVKDDYVLYGSQPYYFDSTFGYNIINHDNAPLTIDHQTGKISVTEDLDGKVGNTYRLTVTVKVKIDNEIIAAQCSGHFIVKKTVQSTTDVQSNIDTYVIESPDIFDDPIEKGDVDFNIDPKEDISIKKPLSMNDLAIGGLENHVKMQDTSVTLNQLILGKEKQHDIDFEIDGGNLTVDQAVTVGMDGVASFKLNGDVKIKEMTVGKNSQSEGRLEISEPQRKWP